jgi:uncharacterized surface protein with fasciclin (FAS1) repeats
MLGTTRLFRWLATLLVFVVTLTPRYASADGHTVLDVGYYAGHTAWVKAVNEAGLMKTVTEHGPFTMFVPTNAAFATIQNSDAVMLRQLVLHHTLQGSYTVEQLAAQPIWKTALGGEVTVEMVNGTLVIDKRLRVLSANLPANNGIVHVVDSVNSLPNAYGEVLVTGHYIRDLSLLDLLVHDADCAIFVSELEEQGLEHLFNQHGTFTVFVPADAVFAALPAGTMAGLHSDHRVFKQTLLYHIVLGDVAATANVTVNTALGKPLTVADGRVNGTAQIVKTSHAANGTIHMIDALLTPPANVPYTPEPVKQVTDGTLLGAIGRTATLTTFLNEVEMVGLENLLARHGNFTIFAPTNAAYAAMDGELMTACMVDHRLMKQLTLHHIVRGAWTPEQIARSETLPTALGDLFTLQDVTIVGSISAENGVVYIIDTVQIPEMLAR